MSLTNSYKRFVTDLQSVNGIMDDCEQHFKMQGYSVQTEETATGGFISLTKGGLFETIAGMKTGLNITLIKTTGAIEVKMEVGVFGNQFLPTAMALLVFRPFLISQIYGLIQQDKLDVEAYSIIESSIRQNEKADVKKAMGDICPYCGKDLPEGSVFCIKCGKKVLDDFNCPKCGAKLSRESAFCHRCGVKLENAADVDPE